MEFRLTAEQEAIRKTVSEFAEKQVAPLAAEIDSAKRFPRETIPKMADLGLLGVTCPAELGGAGLDYVSYTIVIEELSRACAATGVIASVTNTLAGYPLLAYGNALHHKKFLEPMAQGRTLGAFALSEPDAGSDPAAMKTTAVKKGHSYVLNGQKNFITNGGHADTYIVFAKTAPELKHKGIGAFVVPKNAPGFTCSPPEDKMGIRAAHSTQLFFDSVEIPAENLLGKEGDGFKIAMATLDRGRIGIAAQAVGIAQAALEASVSYAKERRAFNRPIGNFQLVKEMIAEMAVDVEAGRQLVYRAAWLKANDKPARLAISMAKLFTAKMAMRVTENAVQIYGGLGYTTDVPVERYFRDAKICGIYEGTNQIQQIIIADEVLGIQ